MTESADVSAPADGQSPDAGTPADGDASPDAE